MTPDEVVVMLKQRSARKDEQLKKTKEAIMSVKDDENATLALNITEEDAELLASTKVKLTQKDILRSFVGNWATLTLKQRRQVMGHVQAQRAVHAKHVFLKELATIGRRLEKNNSETKAVKGKKDPMKLKLENIGL
jgi:hypothetical protein